MEERPWDLAIIGAGAAGLWAGLCAARRLNAREHPGLRIAVLDGRVKFGAKILMSGGTRCNLTHVEVGPDDFRGGNRNRVARVLKHQSAQESRAIFERELGLATKTEPNGKIFPADDSARSVLAALVRGVESLGVSILSGLRCADLELATDGRWQVSCVDPEGAPLPSLHARRIIVATGGLSFPKSGSDGSLHPVLRRLGHSLVPFVPALTPIVLAHPPDLAGIATPVKLALLVGGKEESRAEGAMLWTHFGVSGPAALDLSGPWARARVDRPALARVVHASFLPEEARESLEARWLALARSHPASTLRTLCPDLPRRLLDHLAASAAVDPAHPLAQSTKEARRRAIEALVHLELPVIDVLGFEKAEVTSGGVPLEELDARMQSRLAPGLYFAGEVLHVDGRLGGFNFQWAWSSAALAAESAVDALIVESGE